MPYLSLIGVAVALCVWAVRSKIEPRNPPAFWLLLTGCLVLALARFLVWISTIEPWSSTHPVRVDLLRGLATELVGAFLAVVVIEWLLDRHRKTMDRSLRGQVEVVAATQLSQLAAIVRRIRKIEKLDSGVRWSLEDVERQLVETEGTVLRLASLDPSYVRQIQDFLTVVARLRDSVWNCLRWIEGGATPEACQPAWQAFGTIADQSVTQVQALQEQVSAPAQVALLNLVGNRTV